MFLILCYHGRLNWIMKYKPKGENTIRILKKTKQIVHEIHEIKAISLIHAQEQLNTLIKMIIESIV